MAVPMKELLETVDTMDAQKFAEWFTKDGRFRFGNAPTTTGRDAIAAAVAEFFSSLDSLHHDIFDVWEQGDTVVTELEVTYNRKDGKDVTLPAATIARCEGDRLADYRIYMDINPLFQ